MSSASLPKVAGIHPAPPPVSQTSGPAESGGSPRPRARPRASGVQDRLASWIADLTTLHDLTERLGRTTTLHDALRETLRGGASLVGARRGLFSLRPTDGRGPEQLVGLGLGRAELGDLETVPQSTGECSAIAAAPPEYHPDPTAPAQPGEFVHRDIANEHALDPRHREVAARLGFAASYGVSLTADTPGRLGAAVWLYDEPAQPDQCQRRLLSRYLRQAAQHIANRLELTRAHTTLRTVRDGLLPGRLPRLPGVALAARHHTGPNGGADFYEVLALPGGGLGIAVGAAMGSGPVALAAMGRLRAGLRAYAVMEGEDPVAVLSDLELLLRLTEPASPATTLYGYAVPAARRLVLASAGHPPPLVIGAARVQFAETARSAPLNMLACWEAPSIELEIVAGDTVLLYSGGLLHRTGEPMDGAFARLRAAAVSAPPGARADPEALVDHILHTVLPDIDALGGADAPEDVVLLAAHFPRS